VTIIALNVKLSAPAEYPAVGGVGDIRRGAAERRRAPEPSPSHRSAHCIGIGSAQRIAFGGVLPGGHRLRRRVGA